MAAASRKPPPGVCLFASIPACKACCGACSWYCRRESDKPRSVLFELVVRERPIFRMGLRTWWDLGRAAEAERAELELGDLAEAEEEVEE